MGKVTKKKSTAKKKTTTKKTTKTKSPAKAKSPAKKKTATKAKTAAKKTPAKKKAAKISIKDLVLKKFEPWKPDTLFSVKAESTGFTAPPFYSDMKAAETKKIAELLSRKFDPAELKAAAEKAAAEKAAAEKAAAEKAAAEKAAAEKAAAEKAAAEKAAAEKAAAEKAAAEKAAAEKAAAEKAAADSANPTPAPAYKKPIKEEPEAIMDRTMKLSLAALGLIFLILVGYSVANKNTFYLKPSDGGVEIWRGRFGPMGNECVVALPVPAPKNIKESYTKQEVFPIAFNYYMGQANALLEQDEIPDFKEVRSGFATAGEYAARTEDIRKLKNRYKDISLMEYLCMADIETSKGTKESLQVATGYLEKAAALELDKNSKTFVDRKIAIVKDIEKAIVAEAKAKEAKAKAEAEAAKDKVAEAPKEKAEEVKDKAGEAPKEKAEAVKDKAGEAPKEKAEAVKDKAGEAPKEKAEAVKDKAGEAPKEKAEAAKDKTEEAPKAEAKAHETGKTKDSH